MSNDSVDFEQLRKDLTSNVKKAKEPQLIPNWWSFPTRAHEQRPFGSVTDMYMLGCTMGEALLKLQKDQRVNDFVLNYCIVQNKRKIRTYKDVAQLELETQSTGKKFNLPDPIPFSYDHRLNIRRFDIPIGATEGGLQARVEKNDYFSLNRLKLRAYF